MFFLSLPRGQFSGPHIHDLSHPGGVSLMSWLALGARKASSRAPSSVSVTASSLGRDSNGSIRRDSRSRVRSVFHEPRAPRSAAPGSRGR